MIAAALGVATLAWWELARFGLAHGATGAAHAAGPVSDLAVTTWLWLLMMVAMMLPAVLPWLAAYAGAARGREAALGTGLFALGYLAAWGGFSLAAASIQVATRHGLERVWEPFSLTGGGLLVGAGVFQLTPLKQACLKHCRSPIGYFLTRWQSGRAGAFRMGLDHGGYCLLCCWALMALMLLTGAMSPVWMAALTLLLCVEKLAPAGPLASRLVGVALLAWGGTILMS